MSQPLDQGLGELYQPCMMKGTLKWICTSSASDLYAFADPILAYSAGAEVNQLQWSASQPDWVAICFGNKTQILRV